MESESKPEPDLVIEDAPTSPFPQAGRDLTPTSEMISKGAHGNGAWDLTTADVAVAYHERHQQKVADQDARLEHFHEEAKGELSEAVRLHGRLIAAGHRIMDKIENAEKVNGAELNILGKALSSSKELTDRTAGRPKVSAETMTETSGLAFLIAGGD